MQLQIVNFWAMVKRLTAVLEIYVYANVWLLMFHLWAVCSAALKISRHIKFTLSLILLSNTAYPIAS